jgi:hypothetical protein
MPSCGGLGDLVTGREVEVTVTQFRRGKATDRCYTDVIAPTGGTVALQKISPARAEPSSAALVSDAWRFADDARCFGIWALTVNFVPSGDSYYGTLSDGGQPTVVVAREFYPDSMATCPKLDAAASVSGCRDEWIGQYEKF